MVLTQKWDQNRAVAACGRCTTALRAVGPAPGKKEPTLPTRGYRKGISDRKQPAPRSIRTHVTEPMFIHHAREADARNLTLSRLLYEVLKAHQACTRLEAPQSRAADAALLRELARIGNNVNQVAHQANLMNLPLIVDKAVTCLASLDDLLRRLGR